MRRSIYRPRRQAKGDFNGFKLRGKTHRSTVDQDSVLYWKSNAHTALPSYQGTYTWKTTLP